MNLVRIRRSDEDLLEIEKKRLKSLSNTSNTEINKGNKKLVVALICHFTNKEIQSILKPWKKIPEMAPWIPFLISVFENSKQVELHVISPHEYIWHDKSFRLRNITYHFFNAHIPFYGRHYPMFFKFDVLTNFVFNKFKVNRIVSKIKPDILHLFGAENAYYSSAIFQFFNRFPVVITVQGFIFKTTMEISKVIKKRILLERQIIQTFTHYITTTETMGEDILKLNPKAQTYLLKLPLKVPNIIDSAKEYDVVFFARICKDKGIVDLLKAIALLIRQRPDISLCAIGGGNTDEFMQLANDLGIAKNITWSGFLPTQKDVHKLALKAKISVLPTHHDIISGTIVESLFLKLPVVAYDVGSIHEVNKNEEIISLVEKGNIAMLAEKISYLLDHEEIREQKAEQGYHRAHEMFDVPDEKIISDLLKAYHRIVQDFNNL